MEWMSSRTGYTASAVLTAIHRIHSASPSLKEIPARESDRAKELEVRVALLERDKREVNEFAPDAVVLFACPPSDSDSELLRQLIDENEHLRRQINSLQAGMRETPLTPLSNIRPQL